MKFGRVFLSGCAVYIIVAACSAVDPGRPDREAVGAAASGGESGTAGPAGGSGPGGGSGGSGGSSAGGGIMDPVPAANADPTSGTRLKAKSWRGSDGSIQYMPSSWFDNLMMVSCVATAAADGTTRCLPEMMFPVSAASVWFEDASCTAMVAPTQIPCPWSLSYVAYYTGTSTGECPARVRVRRVGPSVTLNAIYRIDSSGACVGQASTDPITLSQIGDEILPSEFVEMTLQVEP